jgi:hypothetical protein
MPVLEALHAIWYVMMEKFSTRKTRKFQKSDKLIDYAQLYINDQFQISCQYLVISSSDSVFVVFTETPSGCRKVDFDQGICSCGDFQDITIN